MADAKWVGVLIFFSIYSAHHFAPTAIFFFSPRDLMLNSRPYLSISNSFYPRPNWNVSIGFDAARIPSTPYNAEKPTDSASFIIILNARHLFPMNRRSSVLVSGMACTVSGLFCLNWRIWGAFIEGILISFKRGWRSLGKRVWEGLWDRTWNTGMLWYIVWNIILALGIMVNSMEEVVNERWERCFTMKKFCQWGN